MKNTVQYRSLFFRWIAVFGLWTLIGLSFAGQLYLTQSKIGNPITWTEAVARSLSDWYVFAILSLPALWLARRFQLDRGSWPANLSLHILASAVFSMGWMIARAALEAWQRPEAPKTITFAAAFQHALVATFFFNVLIYWTIIVAGHAVAYYRRFYARELRTIELEKRLTEARLQALQMQLNPHFLFNTLHAMSALVHKNAAAAEKMIVRLSDLLRYTLDSSHEHEVALNQELAFLKGYIEIEQIRFGPRLHFQQEIDPSTLNALVPNLILQPLVENAIRHGIERSLKPGTILLSARRTETMLELEVADTGPGINPDSPQREGIGLSNSRARLEQLYGDAQSLRLESRPGWGLVVALRIPLRLPGSNAPQTVG